MELVTEKRLGALGGRVALVSRETSLIQRLWSWCPPGSTGFKYSEEYAIDVARLGELVAQGGVAVAVVILSASGSSDLWLDPEHGPSTRRICEEIRRQGLRLCFLVRPTGDARERWAPDSGRVDPADVFRGFWAPGDQPVLVSDSRHEPPRREDAPIHELAVRDRAKVAPRRRLTERVSARTVPLLVMLASLAAVLVTMDQRYVKLKEMQAEVEKLTGAMAKLESEMQAEVKKCKASQRQLKRQMETRASQRQKKTGASLLHLQRRLNESAGNQTAATAKLQSEMQAQAERLKLHEAQMEWMKIRAIQAKNETEEKLSEQKAAVVEMNSNVQVQVEELREAMTALNSHQVKSAEIAGSQLKGLQVQVKELNQSQEAWMGQIVTRVGQERNESRTSLEGLKGEVQAQVEQLKVSQEARMEQLETQATDLRATLKYQRVKLDETAGLHSAQVMRLNSTVDSVRGRTGGLEAQVQELRTSQTEMTSHAGRITTLEGEAAGAKDSMAHLRTQVQELEASQAGVEKELKVLPFAFSSQEERIKNMTVSMMQENHLAWAEGLKGVVAAQHSEKAEISHVWLHLDYLYGKLAR